MLCKKKNERSNTKPIRTFRKHIELIPLPKFSDKLYAYRFGVVLGRLLSEFYINVTN